MTNPRVAQWTEQRASTSDAAGSNPAARTNIWVEQPRDTGSAVWGCSTCDRGAWCWDHTTALLEARTHARSHGVGITDVTVVGRKHGRTPGNDTRIATLRAEGLTIVAIAARIGYTAAGVSRALRRIKGVRDPHTLRQSEGTHSASTPQGTQKARTPDDVRQA